MRFRIINSSHFIRFLGFIIWLVQALIEPPQMSLLLFHPYSSAILLPKWMAQHSKAHSSAVKRTQCAPQQGPGLIVLVPSEITRTNFLYGPINWKALSLWKSFCNWFSCKNDLSQVDRHKLALCTGPVTQEMRQSVWNV